MHGEPAAGSDDRSSPGTSRETRRLALAASFAGLLLSSFVYAFVLPQTPARLARPTADLIGLHPLWSWLTVIPIPREPETVAALVLLTGALAFGSYALAAWASWHWPGGSRAARTAVLGGIALLSVSVAAFPNVSTDIYNYMLRGRVAAVHGENPYETAADRFAEDPVYPYASHRFTNEPGGKPPTWMALNIVLARSAGDGVVDSLLVYRGVLLIFGAGSLGLVLWILGRLDPRHALAGVVLLGWNPIVMLYGTSKTDIVMVFFLLVGVAALTLGHKGRAAVALALSGFVKLITLPLAAAFGLRELWKRRWRDAARVGFLFLATAGLLILPFSSGLELATGFVDAAGSAARDEMPLRPLWLVGLGVVAYVGVTREEGLAHLLRGWAIIALYFTAFLMPFSLAWHQLTLIAVVALVRDLRIVLAMGALSLSSFGIATWRLAEGGGFELPLHLPVPGHIAFLIPLVLLVAAAGLVLLYGFPSKERAAG